MQRKVSFLDKWFTLLRVGPIEPPDPAVLDSIYQRRFAGADRARFGELWCEIARIVRVSPQSLHEDDDLEDLVTRASRFPPNVKDELAETLVWESTGTPRKFKTVGDMMDFLLSEPV